MDGVRSDTIGQKRNKQNHCRRMIFCWNATLALQILRTQQRLQQRDSSATINTSLFCECNLYNRVHCHITAALKEKSNLIFFLPLCKRSCYRQAKRAGGHLLFGMIKMFCNLNFFFTLMKKFLFSVRNKLLTYCFSKYTKNLYCRNRKDKKLPYENNKVGCVYVNYTSSSSEREVRWDNSSGNCSCNVYKRRIVVVCAVGARI